MSVYPSSLKRSSSPLGRHIVSIDYNITVSYIMLLANLILVYYISYHAWILWIIFSITWLLITIPKYLKLLTGSNLYCPEIFSVLSLPSPFHNLTVFIYLYVLHISLSSQPPSLHLHQCFSYPIASPTHLLLYQLPVLDLFVLFFISLFLICCLYFLFYSYIFKQERENIKVAREGLW